MADAKSHRPRSRSLASTVIDDVERNTSGYSSRCGSQANGVQRLTPIHEAQSYQPQHQQQQQLLDLLVADGVGSHAEATPTRLSAKVHFRSVDDLSGADDDDDAAAAVAVESDAGVVPPSFSDAAAAAAAANPPTSAAAEATPAPATTADAAAPLFSPPPPPPPPPQPTERRRTYSEATSWTASESDMIHDDDGAEGFVPPDGGWGWVVVLASLGVNLIADGATFSFGIIYVELVDYFEGSRGYTAWIGGLLMAIPLLSGPLASSLTDRYGCRRVTIAGSLLSALGFLLSSVSDSLEVLFFTLGIISGLGLSLCYVAAIVIVAYYFDKRRSLATGLSVCGGGLGTFIFAPLTQYLIEWYGWRGTLAIVAGLFLNMSVCGALMRDADGGASRRRRRRQRQQQYRQQQLQQLQQQQQQQHRHYHVANGHKPRSRLISFVDTEDGHSCTTPLNDDLFYGDQLTVATCDDVSDDNGDGDDVEASPAQEADVRLCNSLISLPTFLSLGEGDKIPPEVLFHVVNNPQLYAIVKHNYPHLFRHYVDQQPLQPHRHPPGHDGQQDDDDAVAAAVSASAASRYGRRSLAYPSPARSPARSPASASASATPLVRLKKQSLTYRGAMLNLPRHRLRASSCPDLYRDSITTIAGTQRGSCWDFVRQMPADVWRVHESYLRNPRFVLFVISNVLLYASYHVLYLYVTDWALEQGHDEEDASFLLSVVGILNTFGEVMLGYLGDRPWVNATWIYAGCMLICGLSTAVVPLLTTYTALATASGFFGIGIAGNYSLAAVILVEVISLEGFVNAYGLLLMFQGVANLVGPPLAGWVRDVTGSYDASFYVAGVFSIFSGIILVMLPAFEHVRHRLSAGSAADSTATSDASLPEVGKSTSKSTSRVAV